MINLIAVVLETHNFCVRIHQIEHDLQKLFFRAWVKYQEGGVERKESRKRSFVKTNVFEIFLLSRKNATNHETVKIALAALCRGRVCSGWGREEILTILHSEIYPATKYTINSTKTSKFHSRQL